MEKSILKQVLNYRTVVLTGYIGNDMDPDVCKEKWNKLLQTLNGSLKVQTISASEQNLIAGILRIPNANGIHLSKEDILTEYDNVYHEIKSGLLHYIPTRKGEKKTWCNERTGNWGLTTGVTRNSKGNKPGDITSRNKIAKLYESIENINDIEHCGRLREHVGGNDTDARNILIYLLGRLHSKPQQLFLIHVSKHSLYAEIEENSTTDRGLISNEGCLTLVVVDTDCENAVKYLEMMGYRVVECSSDDTEENSKLTVYSSSGNDDSMLFPETDIPSEFSEGNVRVCLVNKYERDISARKQCVALKGCKCSVCGIDFSEMYGKELGHGFIHVHHVLPLSAIRKGYQPDPATDLIPVCPNCHAMIHRMLRIREVKSKEDCQKAIDELKGLFKTR